jgi:hypothetical protein
VARISFTAWTSVQKQAQKQTKGTKETDQKGMDLSHENRAGDSTDWPCGPKAAEGCRTPKPFGIREASWSAPVLWRFGSGFRTGCEII